LHLLSNHFIETASRKILKYSLGAPCARERGEFISYSEWETEAIAGTSSPWRHRAALNVYARR
jgi:hypothetical protein